MWASIQKIEIGRNSARTVKSARLPARDRTQLNIMVSKRAFASPRNSASKIGPSNAGKCQVSPMSEEGANLVAITARAKAAATITTAQENTVSADVMRRSDWSWCKQSAESEALRDCSAILSCPGGEISELFALSIQHRS